MQKTREFLYLLDTKPELKLGVATKPRYSCRNIFKK